MVPQIILLKVLLGGGWLCTFLKIYYGVRGQVKAFFLDFLNFEICYSPVSLLSKMLSYFAQLSAVQKLCT